MKDGKICYGVLGLGIGLAHAAAVAAVGADDAYLCAICDINHDRLREASEEYPEARAYSDFEQMLDDVDIDIISICLPSGMHADYAIRAMKRKKHVLIEKPVDITLEKACEIERVSAETGMCAGVVYQNRANLVMYPFKAAVDSGRLGRILLGSFAVRWYRENSYYEGNGSWHGTWDMDGGGSLINQSIHTVDIMQWLMGDVYSVTSTTALLNHNIETEDYTASVIKFTNGAVATFVSTTCAYPGIGTEISLFGSEGSISVDADKLKVWKFKDSDSSEEREMYEKYGSGNRAAAKHIPGAVYGHKYPVRDMISAVKEGRAPAVTVREAMRSLATVKAVYESARSGKEIIMKEFCPNIFGK